MSREAIEEMTREIDEKRQKTKAFWFNEFTSELELENTELKKEIRSLKRKLRNERNQK